MRCANATFSADRPDVQLTIILINNRMRAILVCISIVMNQATSPNAPDQPTSSASVPRRRIDSDTLLQGAPALEINHAGQTYLLRVTRENKLILTK